MPRLAFGVWVRDAVGELLGVPVLVRVAVLVEVAVALALGVRDLLLVELGLTSCVTEAVPLKFAETVAIPVALRVRLRVEDCEDSCVGEAEGLPPPAQSSRPL